MKSKILTSFERRSGHATQLFTFHFSLFTAISVAALATLVAGCGFHLRGQASLPFESIYVSGSPAFAKQLTRAVRAVSKTRITDNPKDAEVTLHIVSEQRERVILSLSAAGRIREITLRYRVSYRITDAKGIEYTSPSEIALHRDVTYNDTGVLGKAQEENLLYLDMRNDAVQQVVRRLQVAKLETGGPAAKDAE